MAERSEKFAPGPWHITECLDYWVHADGEALVAHCGDIDWPDFREKQFEWLANAHLIAAAPDLYNVLSNTLAALEYCGLHPEDPLAAKVEATKRAATKVLARARGETQ